MTLFVTFFVSFRITITEGSEGNALSLTDQERECLSAVRHGDREAFGWLYDQYALRIYRFVYYKTHHRQTAEDLTSAVFMKALERVEAYDEARGSLVGWLYQIARNTVIDHYRTAHPMSSIDDLWDLSGKASMEVSVDDRLEVERIEAYLRGLPSIERDVLMMRLWEGMNHREIADALGKSEANCKQIFSRALRALKQTLPSVLGLLVAAASAVVS